MKLYAIRDWDKHYENSRTRNRPELRWLPVPTRLDGEHFMAIMQHKDGAVIFAGFILLLEVASACVPRGTLVRSNGAPHTVKTLSAKCRCPDTWFVTALTFLEQHTDWLAVSHVADGPTVGDTPLSPPRQAAITNPSHSVPLVASGLSASERITREKELKRVEEAIESQRKQRPPREKFDPARKASVVLTEDQHHAAVQVWADGINGLKNRRAELLKLLGMAV